MKLHHLVPVGLLIISSSAQSNESFRKEDVVALSSAVHEYMIGTYACQNYVGGLAMYRSAKLATESIFLKMGVDRNKAILLIDEAEKKIKAEAPEKRMEKPVKGITKEDKRNSCIETIANIEEKVKLLQAKLGLL